VKAARKIYQTEKFKSRGEFGELFLHIAVRQHFKTFPAVSKIYFKDSPNKTVAGFDIAHVVISNDDEFELWFGEAKLYKEIHGAIASAIESLKKYQVIEYAKTEFAIISDYVDDSWEHAAKFKNLIHQDVPIDYIFSKLVIPVFLGYECPIVGKHQARTGAYIEEMRQDFISNHELFINAGPPKNLTIVLFLLPIPSLDALRQALHGKLRAAQGMG
jgi:Cap4 SAVED domain